MTRLRCFCPRVLCCLLFISILLIVICDTASAVELKGHIASVTGSRIQIRLDGDKLPQPGDAVALHEQVPGVGLLPVRGQWKVTVVDKGAVSAEPVGDASQPQEGQIAVITSAHPQSVGQLEQNAKQLYDRGSDYYYGRNGLPKDHHKAIKLIRRAASQGYAPAQSDLGYMYSKGHGVKQDYREAFGWTRKAAMQGNVSAQYNLGLSYYQGQGVDADLTEGTKWFRRAAEQGHTSSQAIMGSAYFHGSGVEQDYAAAAVWFGLAASGGDADSQCMLGLMYLNGQGVAKETTKARQWFESAANQNSACGQKQLGFIYWGDDTVADNKRIAFSYFELAAKQGDASGQRLVGLFYEKGYGVSRDEQQARVWYGKAAAQGDKEAQKKLAALGPLSPATSAHPTNTASRQPVGSKIPAGAQPYLDMLQSSDGRVRNQGARQLHDSSFARDPQVLRQVSDLLLAKYNTRSRDRNHADTMAWLCNILGASGDRRYAATLETVNRKSTNKKIKKYARKNLHRLR